MTEGRYNSPHVVLGSPNALAHIVAEVNAELGKDLFGMVSCGVGADAEMLG